MLATIKHQDTGPLVVAAKCLTSYLKTNKKVSDIDSYIKINGTFDADFVAFMVSWQTSHGCTPDGVIGPNTWAAISKAAPTCSTSKNRISGYTLALQLILGGNLTADAIYGQNTKAAVVTAQDANSLTTDGICGPKTWAAIIVGSDPAPEPTPGKYTKPIDYKQAAKPWGPKMYSNHGDPNQTMANSGCGPTAMADIVATFVDPNINPYDLAELAMAWGDRSYNAGTNWSFFPHIAEYYNFPKMVQTKNLDALKACLDAGGYVVCSMGVGYWTKGGHYICAWMYDNKYIYANDPASSKRTKQAIADFVKERKQFFCFYPLANKEDNAGGGGEYKPGIKRGTKICDISKHKPKVNYDKFIADTSLIILRAGYRGEGTTGLNGKCKIDECFNLHASELLKRFVRFGVFWYSIANTVEKAREEARAFYEYAKDYNPYFWALDAEKPEIITEAFIAFADELRRLGAEKVGCYVANHLYQKYNYDRVRGVFDFTWIPNYLGKPVYKCDLWQYTSKGTVDGINSNVDLSRITGDGRPLEWFIDLPEPGTGV